MAKRSVVGFWLTAAVLAGAVNVAGAATVTNISSTIINSASTGETYTVAQTPTAGTLVENVPPAASFGFTDSFNQTGNISTAADFGATATGAGAPWNFQDNIVFSTNGAAVQAQAIAQLNNVSDLQIRIISLSDPSNPGGFFDVTSSANGAHLVGGGSVVTIQNGWTNFIAGGVNFTATMANVVNPGSYILQIRGEAAPGVGSTYSGNITFTPVPLPAALPLLMSGLGLFGGASARRRNTVSA
jgi:hypothetical protein